MSKNNYVTKTNKRSARFAHALTIGAVMSALSLAMPVTNARAQEPAARPAPPVELAYVMPQSVGIGRSGAQLPQDIRIMQRIVSTALGEVEAPELPAVLQAPEAPEATGTYVYAPGGREATVWTLATGNRMFSIGSRDVTGFYMQGYGYLFTVKWRVAPRGIAGVTWDGSGRVAELNVLLEETRRAAAAQDEAQARAAGEAEKTLEQRRQETEQRQQAWDTWSEEYRSLLAEGLRQVVAGYGSTLNRAMPDESITFIADFGGDESDTVTVSARRGDLSGSRDANLGAVQLARGETSISDNLRTELKIMAEIIDSALQVRQSDDAGVVVVEEIRYFGGDSSYQYVPGYGVLFRKSARLNLATQVVRSVMAPSPGGQGVVVTPEKLRAQINETTEEQQQAYADHLADLKQRTAEIMATYGPTLSELGDDDWVGIYYNVGSAAGLLEGGITNYLVQARMADIRQTGGQADGADWLLGRLVTNERQD